jgi:protein disulfide-isomerase A1
MFLGSIQGALLAVVIILTQTTKRIHCDDTSTTVDESHVLSLTKDTFDNAVKNNKHLLVKFVAPWCGHCKTLLPAYAAAAKQLVDSGSDIKLASVDATIEQDLAQKYDVKVYPTIKFFSDGTTFDYTGGRAPDDIISWLKEKTGPVADELKTVDDLKKLKEANEVVVIGAFKDTDGDAAASFLQVAKTIDGIPFGITSNKDVLKELDIKQDTIVLLKKVSSQKY